MLHLTRTSIRSMAANDLAYTRGIQYYKNHQVVNAAYSNKTKQYRVIVKGNNHYTVSIGENDSGTIEYTCNCPTHLKEKGACKHVVAAMLFLMKYQEQSIMKEPMTMEEKKSFRILEYFDRHDEVIPQGDIFRIVPIITIPNILKNEETKAYVSLRAGSSKLYKVQGLKKFLLDYTNGENILLGKEFKFIHGENEFDRQSKSIIRYFVDLLDIQDALEQSNSAKIFMKSQLILSKRMLVRFLEAMKDISFHLELYYKKYPEVTYVSGNPVVRYELTYEEDQVSLDYGDRDLIVPITEDGQLLYRRGVIYQPDKKFLENYLPLYKNLGATKSPLYFSGKLKEKFLETVLPRITETMDIKLPEELKSLYVQEDLKIKVYFDLFHKDIKAEIRLQYGPHEFNAFEQANTDTYIIIRKKEEEERFFSYMERLKFEPFHNFYLLKGDKRIYDFLTNSVEELSAYAELFYSSDFKKMKVKTPATMKTNVRLSSDLNLLELDFESEDIPKEEMVEFIRAYRLKKKYYRLKNGNFIDLNQQAVKEVAEIFDKLDVAAADFKDDVLTLSKNKALYLNEALKDSNIEVWKEDSYIEFIDQIRNPSKSDVRLPANLNAELRNYQKIGYQWLKTLAINGLGGILADDMGLGKTIQAITYMLSVLNEKKEQFLIICPTSLVYNWKDEIENFAPSMTSEVVTGTPKERQDMIENSNQYDVIITSYPLIRRDIEHYEKLKFHTVFIDEAQFIKNADSLSAQSVKKLNTKNRFALTGTPIENSLSELWSIFDFIMPGYLFSHSRFVAQYEKPIMRKEEDAFTDLMRHIQPFILRRMKRDVLLELPEKIETKVLTDLTEEQKKVYITYLENFKGELKNDLLGSGMEQSHMKILAALTRLRQICCHPSTFIENYNGESGKLNLLMEILTEALSNKHRILIFSQFTSMLAIIAEKLKEAGIEYFTLEGSTPSDDRSDYVKRFNEGERDVFLISLKAGGTGLNLTGADTVIHYDPWWNPAVEDQATDRAYRIGQENKVQVIKLITKGTIEEKIYKLQLKKKELSDSVIQKKEIFIHHLTKEELEDLFTL